jgi:L-fuculose-phosphate aldolase
MTITLEMQKAEPVSLAKEQMQKRLRMPAWSLREMVALTCRILFERGHDSGLAGQITARGEEQGTFYTQQLGLGFDEISASNLLLVDEDLNVLEGEGMPNPANRFHTWLYRARPDVNCIIHTHPFHAATLSMLGQPLIVSHMDTCGLFQDCAFLEKWPGVPTGNEEGELISQSLGRKRAILLAHHGQLVACGSVEESCMLSLQFERAAKMQLAASAVGAIREIHPVPGRAAHDWLLTRKRSETTFFYYARRTLKNNADCLQ